MASTILVPLDGSARSKSALPIIARISRSTGATAVLVCVVSQIADSWQGIMPSNPFLRLRRETLFLSNPVSAHIRHTMAQVITRMQEGLLAPSIARYHIPET